MGGLGEDYLPIDKHGRQPSASDVYRGFLVRQPYFRSFQPSHDAYLAAPPTPSSAPELVHPLFAACPRS
ncbi:hypothetical protein E2C01_089820 [Portunus trituberculatus]|uniref:Uncharacterized protein n=1 Tax=Portunus trituberculatus TaxID=210409 RepID=A0A5B7JEM9_PORTR|nr:hypothetical protein [Portunus trituberculatus]